MNTEHFKKSTPSKFSFSNLNQSPLKSLIFFNILYVSIAVLSFFYPMGSSVVQSSLFSFFVVLYTLSLGYVEYQRQNLNLSSDSDYFYILKNKMLYQTSFILILIVAINIGFYLSKETTTIFTGSLSIVGSLGLILLLSNIVKDSITNVAVSNNESFEDVEDVN